jgi:hypothetical protein
MKFLQKIQALPEGTRKIILWSVMVILVAGLLIWLVQNTKNRIAEFEKDEFVGKLNLSDIKAPEMPDFSGLIPTEQNGTTTAEEVQQD